MAIDFSSRVNLARSGFCARLALSVPWSEQPVLVPDSTQLPLAFAAGKLKGIRKNSLVKSRENSGFINQLLMTGSAARGGGICSLSPCSPGTCWGQGCGSWFGAPVGAGCPPQPGDTPAAQGAQGGTHPPSCCCHPCDGAEPGDGWSRRLLCPPCPSCPLRVLPVPLSEFYSLTGSGVAAWDQWSSSHHPPAHPPTRGSWAGDIPACPQREPLLSGAVNTPR